MKDRYVLLLLFVSCCWRLGDAVQPLYGIVLHGHPYPKRLPSVQTPYTSYLPHYPNQGGPTMPRPPTYYPVPPPIAPVTYRPLPVYPAATVPSYQPTPPPFRPLLVQPYQTTPQYTTPAPYQPVQAPNQPYLPVPTSYDVKPWQPLTESTTVIPSKYVLDAAFQTNQVDGYPWTEQLQEGPEIEYIKTKLPIILFYPDKSLAQQHAEATNIEFNPRPLSDTSNNI